MEKGNRKLQHCPTALTRVMRAVVPIPAVVSASVLHSATVGGSVIGVVGPLRVDIWGA